ncbi:MAG: Uncharacterized protein CEN88_199 [Candidatus Berkelbacteria bacterium Licking1014_2]|uniref:Rod shape-determining protein RodA n=1 Tax=Candidatus Berkelbacteria bacterium Licking1014_2 TaxID=2017146 RepID=A0A554LWN6_9BACT|nr:MAG: Uncharacterized protein CEN88_199 [Candidatus Berkelbacteria bacterium Licking1014_2]
MRSNWPKAIDLSLFFIPVALAAIGLTTLYAGSFSASGRQFFSSQLIFFSIGFVLMLLFSFLDYRSFKGASWIIYLIGLILLGLTLFFGQETFGARRWLDLQFFNLQAGEFFKLALLIFLAGVYQNYIQKIGFRHLLLAVIITAVPLILVLKQPDLGTAVILLLLLATVIFASRPSGKLILAIVITAAVLLPSSWFFLRDYQKERLVTFLNPSVDPAGAGYNVLQSTIAVGAGGLTGRGLGQNTQSQLQFLPVAQTDFIFASWAEATGLIGSLILITLFLILIWRIINAANVSQDGFGRLLAIGAASYLTFQMVVNIGMNIGIMPVTGIPLPFVSHGGSSMLISFIAIGLCQSIYIRHKKISF